MRKSIRSRLRAWCDNGIPGNRHSPCREIVKAELLEDRRLLSASLSAAGLLTVNGTAGVDVVVVNLVAGKVQVKQGGVAIGNYTPSAVKSIVINGLAGNDSLQVLDAVVAPATVNGGDGDDFLRGGGGKDTLNGGNDNDVLDGGLNSDVFNGGLGTDTADYSARTTAVNVSLDGVANDGNAAIAEKDNVMADVENVSGGSGGDTLTGNASANVLVGNSGNDTLRGGTGLDVVIGGNGADNLFGEAGGDLLIGSRTTYDANIPALRTLGYEWRNPANSYATKITRLKAGTPGVKLDKTTVPTDLATDSLTGGTETDWFITHWGDLLKDKASTETATLISSPIRFVSQTRLVESDAAAGFDGASSNYKKKSATGFGAFNAVAESNFLDIPAQEGANGYGSQTSSLADTALSFVGRTSASGSDASAFGNSRFVVTFDVDEPRAFKLAWTRAAYSSNGNAIGGMSVTLSRGTTTVAGGSEDAETGAFDGRPAKTTTKTGTLQVGRYVLEIYLNSGAGPSGGVNFDLSALLTTVPAT